MHPIQCRCGKLQGELELDGVSTHARCYCADCQAFMAFLDRADDVLDVHGGTEIIQVAQPRVKFVNGHEHIRVMRLSEKGLLRWYAGCCNTPLGNTLSSPKLGFVGLITACLDDERVDQDFGVSVADVNTKHATGDPKPKVRGGFGAIGRALWIIAHTRLSGAWRESEFFDATGQPVAEPQVLTSDERNRLKRSA